MIDVRLTLTNMYFYIDAERTQLAQITRMITVYKGAGKGTICNAIVKQALDSTDWPVEWYTFNDGIGTMGVSLYPAGIETAAEVVAVAIQNPGMTISTIVTDQDGDVTRITAKVVTA